jgi:TPR repeat protein
MDKVKPAPDTRIAEAQKALENGDLVIAQRLFNILADTGSKPALLALAIIYERGGNGIPQDYGSARVWYERAYKEGNSVEAALALGRMYYLGQGGIIDYDKAYFYYSKFENTKQPIGLLRLGSMLAMGKGTTMDIAKAKELFKRSAKLGNIHARKNWAVLEVKHGNIVLGISLWIWAIIQGVPLAFFRTNDKRLRAF